MFLLAYFFLFTVISSSLAKLKSLVAQIGDSTGELTEMPFESELKIREHCDSLRRDVDIARETALGNIHKASNTLMSEIDAYERECLSGWRAAKVTTNHVVEDVSKRMRAFLAQQHAYLKSVQVSHTVDITVSHRMRAFSLLPSQTPAKFFIYCTQVSNSHKLGIFDISFDFVF